MDTEPTPADAMRGYLLAWLENLRAVAGTKTPADTRGDALLALVTCLPDSELVAKLAAVLTATDYRIGDAWSATAATPVGPRPGPAAPAGGKGKGGDYRGGIG